jgi:hypothetical protein
MGVDYTFHLKRTGDGSVMAFEVSGGVVHNELWNFLNIVGAKTNDHFRLRIDAPFRPRKTGPRSGSNRLHGHCQDIAEWLIDDDGQPLYTADQVKAAMKRMTAGEGHWRTRLSLDGAEEPISEADASQEEENWANKTLERFADEHRIPLTEYVDPEDPKKGTYKSIGGRTYEEMKAYWREHEQKKSRPR